MEVIRRLQQTPVEQVPAVFIITGEEELLMKRYLQALIQLLIPPGMQDMNLVTYEGKDFTIEILLEAVETLPVMARRKLVVVKNPSFLETKGAALTEKEEKKLLQYLERPSSSTCLLFFCRVKPDGRKKILRAIKKVAHTEDFPRLKEPDFRRFIQQELEAAGKKADQKAVRTFAESFDYFTSQPEQTLQDVSNEIIKLVAYLGDQQRVTQEEVQQTTYAAFQNDIFMLIESFAGKKGAETQVRLHELLSRGEPLMKIIGYLRNQFKLMLRVKELTMQGYTPAKMATKLKQHPYAVKKTVSYSKRFHENDLMWLLNAFLVLDRQMKQGLLDAQQAMELIIAEICLRK
ncbi:DNA polymerase III subunit delta [Anoxynatronum buryatiense]|uniref:DNA polymerase III subunit delta n=1 Tax=Anoxynatronum buryatiense TaxID=489973 RepID=A0AA46AHG2_9CLOT|nr:DNA polymerase III subunit delta [Anoxynatronum buryatiense]SMP39635.1 DNA polymerase III, delta subunit [Anoxynatronum buryatiense]